MRPRAYIWLRTKATNLRLLARHAKARIRQLRARSRENGSSPGSAEWLVQTEIKYGGHVTNVPKKIASPLDPARSGFLTGGDRMLGHGYAEVYSRYLGRHRESRGRLTLVEIGILRGTGLAMWCDLFEDARIIGLDIDLSYYQTNVENLKRRGAFHKNEPEVYEFDQFQENESYLGRILQGARIDVIIDDGCHTADAILTTLKSVQSHLAERFTYFVEDNGPVQETDQEDVPQSTQSKPKES